MLKCFSLGFSSFLADALLNPFDDGCDNYNAYAHGEYYLDLGDTQSTQNVFSDYVCE